MNQAYQEDSQKRIMTNRRQYLLRMNVLFFIIFAVFTVIIVQLANIQFVQGPAMEQSMKGLMSKDTPLLPLRGTIYDASNHKLAYSTATQSLYFNIELNYGNPDKKKLTKTELKNREEALQLAARLADVFKKYGDPESKQITAAMIYNDLMDLTGKVDFVWVPRLIKTNLTQKEMAYLLENKSDFPGIDILEDSVRNYDPDTVAVQTIGYLKKFKGVRETMDRYKQIHENKDELPIEETYLDYEDVGFDGIEYMYQDVLRGSNGVKNFPVNVAKQIIGPMQVTKPTRGNDVHLTIHKEVQLRTEQAIMNHLEKLRSSTNKYEYAPHATTGFAVAMEVDTGNVISIASMPDYNPNVWRNGSISVQNYDAYQYYLNNGAIRDTPAPIKDDELRKKRASSLVYLGSTMKPLSVLIGLQEGFFTPNSRYNDIGYAEIGRSGKERRIWNASRASWGRVSPSSALQHSSNAFMVDMVGNKLYFMKDRDGKDGLQLWDSYMEAFGLGVLTGSGLPRENTGSKDYFVEAENINAQSALAGASFGQQAKYTTLQLAQYAATLANHGTRIKPQFVSKVTDGEGNIIQRYGREVLSEIHFDDAYWDVIEDAMLNVGVQGFEDFPYRFYRKTGTSEQDVGDDNAVFIAYAPADKPKLAVAVVIPEGGYGSYGAAPIARQIFDAYDDVYGLDGVPKKK